MLGRSRWGEEVLPGFSPSFGRGVWPAPCRVRAKKAPVLPLPPQISRVQPPGSGATLYGTPLPRAQGTPQPAAGLPSVRRRDTGSASLADAAPRVFSALCRPGSSHRSVILLRVPKLLLPGQPGPVAREIAARFGDEQDPASCGQDRQGGRLPAPGQPRVAVHEDEDGCPDREVLWLGELLVTDACPRGADAEPDPPTPSASRSTPPPATATKKHSSSPGSPPEHPRKRSTPPAPFTSPASGTNPNPDPQRTCRAAH